MTSDFFQRAQNSLTDKQQHLNQWLEEASASEKQLRLGPCDEQAVEEHMGVIDVALGQTKDGSLGVCQVCHEQVNTSLLEMDYTAAVCLDHLSEEERRQLESELELSQVVQRALFPHQIPTIPGIELAAFSRPAQIVGGDYYDFLQFRDSAPGLVIADVEGHGVSAGLLMTSIQTSLRTLVPESDSPVDVLGRINRFYLHNINFTTFVTVFLGRFEPGRRSFTYCNAGHNPPLLVHHAKEEISWLLPTGPAIGLVEKFELQAETIPLNAGDLLLFYTDGVTEATDAQDAEFGRQRLADLAAGNADLSAQDLLQLIRQAIHGFTDGRPLADDTTLLACKITE
jgi:sigma-B regulation protein RsbU (phosphoserine phosphatase)